MSARYVGRHHADEDDSDDRIEGPAPPAGSRPGDVPDIAWTRKIFVVRVERPTSVQLRIYSEIRAALQRRGIEYSDIVARRVSPKGDRTVIVLDPRDTKRLYATVHRFATLVLDIAAARVQRDVSERPTRQGSLPLSEFVRYKAFYRHLSRPEEVTLALSSYAEWLSEDPDIALPQDPRMLPQLCFPSKHGRDLDDAAGRANFEAIHGKPWTDDQRSVWKVGAFHTRDCLHVARKTLQIGFHWDVQTSRRIVLVNGWDRWEIKRNAYANIHPDGHVRAHEHATRTNRTSLTEGPVIESKQTRAPAHRRRPKQ